MNGRIKKDLLFVLALVPWVLILVVPYSRAVFMDLTAKYPYPCGFVKFLILATMGDMLGIRVLRGKWAWPKGVLLKALVWGVIGMVIALLFPLYNDGTLGAQAKGLLPFDGNAFWLAFLTSAIMNVTFAPAMFLGHRLCDWYIDLRWDHLFQKDGRKPSPVAVLTASKTGVTLRRVVEAIDWQSFVSFSVLKTIPFFWIPCHTVTFLLPPSFRVIASAFLSVALGLLAALAKKGSAKPAN